MSENLTVVNWEWERDTEMNRRGLPRKFLGVTETFFTLWLHWVFVAVLSLTVVTRGCSLVLVCRVLFVAASLCCGAWL